MKLYRVEAFVMFINKKKHFRLRVLEMNARETAKNYVVNNKWIPKENIGVLERIYEGLSIIGFQMHVLEDHLEDAKKNVVQSLKQFVKVKILELQDVHAYMEEMEPIFRHEVLSKDGECINNARQS